MASLLDEVLGQADQTPQSLLQLPDERPPSLQPDPRADALGQTFQAIVDYEKRKHQEGVDAGNWVGGWPWEGGHPTWQAAKGAVDAYAGGMQAGTLKGPGPFTTYQGSPHLFEPTPKNPLGEFSNERIGTGTGGQSEGMGHYTAENEAIAKHYRDLLSGKRNSPEQVALTMDLEANTGVQMPTSSGIATAKSPRQEAADYAAVLERSPPHWPDYAERLDQAARLRAHLPNIPEEAVPPPGPGHMYEVKINADPDRYLQWNQSFSQQHPDVREALSPGSLGLKLAGPIGEKGHYGWVDKEGRLVGTARAGLPPETVFPPDMSGKDIVRGLESMYGKTEAAGILKEAGLPGIKYLDAGSRGGRGEPTHNYVTFDPANMEIIRRYGLAGLMLGGGGLLSPDKQEQ
jgi:hypothetical protein